MAGVRLAETVAASLPAALLVDASHILHDLQNTPIFTGQNCPVFDSIEIDTTENNIHFSLFHAGNVAQKMILPFSVLRALLRDYVHLRDTHQETAGVGYDRNRIETLDMARRGLHNEGAQLICDYWAPDIIVDHDAARHIFSLVALLVRRLGS